MTERGSGAYWLTDEMINEASRIEREKDGKALTEQEVKALKARDFLAADCAVCVRARAGAVTIRLTDEYLRGLAASLRAVRLALTHQP